MASRRCARVPRWAISATPSRAIVESQRFSVVRDFCGHGIGRRFHEAPNILHFGRPGEGPELRAGMFFTIEPMVNAGRPEVKVLDDGWTAVTRDRSLSAQFEHMIGVTEEGCEIFTLSPAGLDRSALRDRLGNWPKGSRTPAAAPRKRARSPEGAEGHRSRMRHRLLTAGPEALADYELLEMVLFLALPRRDTKPIARALLARFGSFAAAIAAPLSRPARHRGPGRCRCAAALKTVQAAALRLARSEVIRTAGARQLGQAWNPISGR